MEDPSFNMIKIQATEKAVSEILAKPSPSDDDLDRLSRLSLDIAMNALQVNAWAIERRTK